MPTYEYACEGCGNNWEVEQRITEAALTECPSCKAPKAQRLISGSRFLLKGGGWYADGYGSKPAAKSNGEKPSADAKTESKPAETKSDSGSSEPKSSPPASSSASS